MDDWNSAAVGRIGIVGLGNMGLAIAEQLNGRFSIVGTDLSPERQAEANNVGIETAEFGTITTTCRTILLSLPHPRASLQVAAAIARDSGIVECVVETSTVTPADVLAVKASLAAAGVELIDVAILSGVAQMRSGTAGLVLAGDAARRRALAPVFDALTTKQTHLNASGTAMAAKVINNAVAHVVMVALSEAIAMSDASGLDADTIVQILAAPDGGLMRPLTHRIAERVFDGDYEGGMSLEAARKDSMLAQQLAQSSGIPLFTIPAAHSVYEIAMSRGWAREDYAALAKLWEEWGDTSFVRSRQSE